MPKRSAMDDNRNEKLKTHLGRRMLNLATNGRWPVVRNRRLSNKLLPNALEDFL
jgi:hypothetical protein